MAMLRFKNVGRSIIFVDSLNLTFRANDVRLVDENVARNDGQLMQCVLSGAIQIAEMGGEFYTYKPEAARPVAEARQPVQRETIVQVPVEPPQEIVQQTVQAQQPDNKTAESDRNVACDEAVFEARRKFQKKAKNNDFEPKNTVPVVMFGEVPQRRSMDTNSEIPMPSYVNPDDVINFSEDSPIHGDEQPGDIIYADSDDKVDIGAEGIADARSR